MAFSPPLSVSSGDLRLFQFTLSYTPRIITEHLSVKKLFFSNRNSAFIFPIHHRLFSTSLRIAENPPLKSNFAVEYLVKSCGLPMGKAIKASKYISHMKSPTNPDSVLRFLRTSGLSDADIRKAVTIDARILCARLETTIKPIVTEFREIGFSPSQVARLISLAPGLFRSKYSSLQRNVEFWKSNLGSLEDVLNASKAAPYLLAIRAEKVVEPNISFLEMHCKISRSQIKKMILRSPSIVTMNSDKLKDAAERAEQLGVPRGSGIFIYALYLTCCHSPEFLDAKIKNLENLGFSETEISSMIKKMPMLLTNSDERIRRMIGFLTSEAGLDHAYIALFPVLVSLSLERRLIPRRYVMKSLELKGLDMKLSFYNAMKLSHEKFSSRFVEPYKDVIPEVIEVYEAARAGKISLKDNLNNLSFVCL